MLNKILLCIISGLFFFGCSQVPKPVPHSLDTQKKIQASEHWNIIAKDVALNISAAIKKQETSSDTSIHFLPNDNSPFCRGFRSFLATHFIKSGMDLKEIDMADYQLDWSVQAVKQEGKRVPSGLPTGTTTSLALLSTGLYKIFDKNSSAIPGIIAASVAMDLTKEIYDIYSMPLPENEIILNVSLKTEDKYIYRSTHIYYVNDLDLAHYYTTRDRLGMDKKFSEKIFGVSD